MSLPAHKSLLSELLAEYPLSAEHIESLGQWEAHTERLLDFLNRIPLLKACYDKPAYVGEGYTIYDHTHRIMAVANQFKEQFEEGLERTTISWNEFQLFLALHKIGKRCHTNFDAAL